MPTPFKIYGLCLFPPELVPFSTYAGIALCFNTCWSVVWSLAGASASSLQDVLSGKSGENSNAKLVGQLSSLVVLFYVLTQFARYANLSAHVLGRRRGPRCYARAFVCDFTGMP